MALHEFGCHVVGCAALVVRADVARATEMNREAQVADADVPAVVLRAGTSPLRRRGGGAC